MRNPSRSQAKLLAVDLDGTLIGPSGHAHGVDLDALRALVAKGGTVSILTGRLYSGTRSTAEAVGVRGPVGCVDGSHLVDVATHATVLHHGIRGEHATRLRDALHATGPATFLFAKDSIVHDGRGIDYLPYVSTWSNDIQATDRVRDHDFWEMEEGVTAVVAVGSESQISRAAEMIDRDLGEAAQVVIFPVRRIGGQWGLVARARGGTKGTALRWLAHHYGVDLSETVVVGDWHNDLPMFKEAGQAFAMAQAPEELKAHATAILPESGMEGGGIARVIHQVFGVRG